LQIGRIKLGQVGLGVPVDDLNSRCGPEDEPVARTPEKCISHWRAFFRVEAVAQFQLQKQALNHRESLEIPVERLWLPVLPAAAPQAARKTGDVLSARSMASSSFRAHQAVPGFGGTRAALCWPQFDGNSQGVAWKRAAPGLTAQPAPVMSSNDAEHRGLLGS
jgi:hypothetical protein